MLVGILVFIVGLLLSVGIHELGHLVPAKKYGVKVSQYFIGFGPTLWSRTVRGTEYGIKALPLGGFVRIAGMLPPGKENRRRFNRKGKLTLAEEARQDSLAELEAGEEEQAFWRLSAPKKIAVMFGGPLTNLVLCLLFTAVALCGIGQPVPSNTVGVVTQCVSTRECTPQDESSPALLAGIQAGDTIVSWNGVPVHDWRSLSTTIASGDTTPVPVEIIRDNAHLTVMVAPVILERQLTDGEGKSVKRALPYVGISPRYERSRAQLKDIPQYMWNQAVATSKALATLPIGLWETTRSLITGEERAANGLVGIVGVADMAGSITSVKSDIYDTASRAGDLLLLIGAMNMTLFLFNMIPLLPLDGGHLLSATYEGLRRRWAKIRGRSDPGPADTARLMPLSYTVAVIFVAMTLLLVFADLWNPVKLF